MNREMGSEGEKRKTVTPVQCGKYYEGWYTVCGDARRGRTELRQLPKTGNLRGKDFRG